MYQNRITVAAIGEWVFPPPPTSQVLYHEAGCWSDYSGIGSVSVAPQNTKVVCCGRRVILSFSFAVVVLFTPK